MKIEMTVEEWRKLSIIASSYTYSEYFGESKEKLSLLPFDTGNKISCIKNNKPINLPKDTTVTFEMTSEVLGKVFRYFKIYTQIENLIEKSIE